MHRFRIPEIFLACFLTVAVFATGMLFANGPNSRYPTQAQSAEKANKPASESTEPKGFWQTVTTDPVSAFTLCLVLVGLAQAVLFYVQLRLIGETLRPAKAAAEAAVDAARIARNAERPYFTPFVPELRFWEKAILENNPFQILEVHLDVNNIGKGVGFLASYGIAHEICRDGRRVSKPLAIRNEIARMPLRADARLEAGAPFENLQNTAEERLALIEFKAALFVYGYVRYYDLFGIFRKTGFMFQFLPNKHFPDQSTFVMYPDALWYDEEEPKT
jgi:hypothetical protein